VRYLSLFSGIEAATQAWHDLGWEPAAFAEIEPFPAAVLAHHYPNVPNLGDVTKHKEWPDIGPVDLICGGSPCQSFSVAGLRKGMDDPRGNLMLTYLAIVDQYRPAWVVYENVPGILSSNGGRDFGAFLGALGQLGYGFAYRVLDAQYVRTRRHRRAVPQRRRRVFVVGYLGDWRRAAAVLFARESLRRDPPPRREAGKGVAPTISARPTGGGGLGTDFDLDGGLICAEVATQPVANPLTARMHKGVNTTMDEGQTMVAVQQVAPTLRGRGFDATDDGTGKGTTIIPVHPFTIAIRGRGDERNLEYRQDGTANALMTPNGGRDGINVGAVVAPVYFDSKGSQVQTDETGAAPTLRAMTHADSHQNGGGQLAVAYSIQAGAVRENPASGPDGVGVQEGHAYTLEARAEVQAVAFQDRTRGDDGRGYDRPPPISEEVVGTLETVKHWNVATPWAVRRLTPVECERLMGFPDGFTAIPWRKKPASVCPDGPRYKALGNSWAVNVAEWVGERIAIVDAWPENETRAARPTNGDPHGESQ